MAEQAQEQPGHTVPHVEHNAISPAARQMPFGNGENFFTIIWPGDGHEADRTGYACDVKFAQMTHEWWAFGWSGRSSRKVDRPHNFELTAAKMRTISLDNDVEKFTDMAEFGSWWITYPDKDGIITIDPYGTNQHSVCQIKLFAALRAQDAHYDKIAMDALGISIPVEDPDLPKSTIEAFFNSLKGVVVTPRTSPAPEIPPTA